MTRPVEAVCQVCATPLVSRVHNARYCSIACRSRAHRRRRFSAPSPAAAEDSAAKELIESTSKFILSELGRHIPDKFPGLLAAALEALGLHANGVTGDGEIAVATRRVLGSLQQIGIGINELRNQYGTGHGQAESSAFRMGHARMAARAATVLSTFMADKYEDQAAPWRAW